MKIHMLPEKSELGIGRVVDAYRRHLPAFGVEFVSTIGAADIVAVHAGCHAKGRQPDVHHCHGLYPTATLDTDNAYFDMNADVIHNVRSSRVITVPSGWVAEMFRRDMLYDPIVLPHGINLDEFEDVDTANGGYGIWAKGHTPGVCDPASLDAVAQAMPDVKFVTTFGRQAQNVKVIGKQPYRKMISALASAGFYLAVVKETFGIQTLEAMALGVPIVGYNFGGTADIVEHGVTGWLAEPNDIENLVAGVRWVMQHRDILSENCRIRVREYSWENVCEQLYHIYNTVRMVPESEVDAPDVSVVISCYNYENFVADAIESVLNQKFTGTVEIIVVNDGSTDGSLDVIREYGDVVTIIDQSNAGVANARNMGIMHARSSFIANLDADDMMRDNFLADLYPAIRDNRDIGVVYGKLALLQGKRRVKGVWPEEFVYTMQIAGQNRVPSCCIFRKEAWERAGGYRARYTPAEDAELWTRIASLGYVIAMATSNVVYDYRLHGESLSRRIEEPDYVGDKGWHHDSDVTPFAAPALGYDKASYPFRNYDSPWVSVIIPVSSNHTELVHKAIDSVWRQRFPYWECVVVNDSGKDLVVPSTGLLLQEAYPFVNVVSTPNPGSGNGAAVARNVGVDAASAPLIAFLDADDEFLEGYLIKCLDLFSDCGDRYVYTDWYNERGERSTAPEFEPKKLLREALHPISILLPKQWHEEIGGFDESLKGWEDWDYALKLAAKGHCGVRLSEPLIMYDYGTGVRREQSLVMKDSLLETIRSRYKERDVMSCKNCNDNRRRSNPMLRNRQPQRRPTRVANQPIASGPDDSRVIVRDNSGNIGAHSVVGRVTRTKYGRKKHGQEFPMHIDDQRAQPHLYIIVEQEQPQKVATVTRPQVVSEKGRVQVDTSPPVKLEEPIEIGKVIDLTEDVSDEEIVEKVADVVMAGDHVAEPIIDISLMTLKHIKTLPLTADDAYDLYEEEAQGKGRKSVLGYLESIIPDEYWDEEEEDWDD